MAKNWLTLLLIPGLKTLTGRKDLIVKNTKVNKFKNKFFEKTNSFNINKDIRGCGPANFAEVLVVVFTTV